MRHHHVPRKRFGQNFLQDEFIIDQIITVIAPQTDQHLIEIGPGLGALTAKILPQVNLLDVIEFDRDLIPLLQKKYAEFTNLNIHQADALQFDFAALKQNNSKLRIFGNLPYNISTPLLFHLTQYHDLTQDMHFMLQKEVAERITAAVGTHQYGRLSIMMQYFYKTELLFTIPPTAFDPVPKVISALVRFIARQQFSPAAKDFDIFATIVKAAFSQRRKTIKNTLKTIIAADSLAQLGINPNDRPEQIAVAQYVTLANFIYAQNPL